MVDPRAQFNSPQLNAADPTRGILRALMERGSQQEMANPAAAKVQQAMGQSQGTNLDMNKAVELMNNPFLDPGKKQVLSAMIDRQQQEQDRMRQEQDPLRQMQLEKGRLELDAMRNPQPKPTDDMREYEFARSQGFEGSYLDFQTSLKKAGATNVTTNMGEGDKFYENLDKKNAETFSALSETGMQGRSKLAQIDRLDGLLAASPQGAAAMLKQAAGEYGINTEGLNDIQAAQALINELVPQQRQPGSGPMSDADLALFKQSLPRLINQPDGNRAIIDTMRGITQYQIQMGQIADAVSNREMTPAEGRKAIASLPNPLEGFGKIAKGAQQQTPAPDGQQTIQPGTVDGEYRFKGGDPSDQNNWERVM
jgi:flagellar protein FlgJ